MIASFSSWVKLNCEKFLAIGLVPSFTKSSTKYSLTKSGKPSATYKTWMSMKDRCYREEHEAFANYGGRGIKVCKRWLKFENFLADMGERPQGMTLDRIDNDKGYSKSNCRWATQESQSNNKRTCIYLTYQGKTQTIAQWARELKLPHYVILRRYHRGLRTKQILSTGC